MNTKELLRHSFIAARSEFDKISSRCEDAFEEWYNANITQFEGIECYKTVDIESVTERFRSVVKFDKNFHLYIHGSKDNITNGEDENGKFVKIRYDIAHW